MEPYYDDGVVRLYLADCRDVADEWAGADFLLTDPPYGRGWQQGNLHAKREKSSKRVGIAGDKSTEPRDWVLDRWGSKPAAVFGDLMLAPPDGTKQVLVYQKPPDAGVRGATGGFRRDAEAIYLLGDWVSAIGGRTSVLGTTVGMLSGASGYARSVGHPHAKPLDVLMELIPAGCATVADPFAGSGSTLIAARRLGLQAVGVEVDEQYASRAATRLSQPEMIE